MITSSSLQAYVRPVTINGLTREFDDWKEDITQCVNVLRRGFNKPKATKKRSASFVVHAAEIEEELVSPQQLAFAKRLLK